MLRLQIGEGCCAAHALGERPGNCGREGAMVNEQEQRSKTPPKLRKRSAQIPSANEGAAERPGGSIIPFTLRKANDFVQAHHRHNGRTARDGGKFAIALEFEGQVVGVAIVGNPLSATYMDGLTAEILRVCVSEGAPPNSNSMLYGACRRTWFGMGGVRLLTYTLTTESGASLKAAGFRLAAEIKGHDPATWGKDDHLTSRQTLSVVGLRKFRWECRR